MKVTVLSPVKNEAEFIGFSVMSVLDHIHEIIYALAPSDDGTFELLTYIKDKYDKENKIKIYEDKLFDFNVRDMDKYNYAFNFCIEKATGTAVWFLHPDMICLNSEAIEYIQDGPFAWWTNMDSYAGDLTTRITTGRINKWKNIHLNKFGVHYYGGYGSQNEDFYFKDITGNEHIHHDGYFEGYPYLVKDSGIDVNHYCELKTYDRRFEKMVKCLKTQLPDLTDLEAKKLASEHPRVTLKSGSGAFGAFDFKRSESPIPNVFSRHKEEFEFVLGRKLIES